MNREAELSAPVTTWLKARGLTVYSEVPLGASKIDLVGATETPLFIVSVELKLSFTHGVLRQAYRAVGTVHEAYACTFSKLTTKSLADAVLFGIGVLRVVDGAVHVILKPKTKEKDWQANPVRIQGMANRLKRMAAGGIGGIGGMACTKGEGPRKRVLELLLAYLKKNPKASWQEIFENVPNHYQTARSFQGSLCMEKSRAILIHNARKGIFQ